MDEEHEEEKVKCIRILWSVCKFFTFPYYYWIKNTDSRSVEKKSNIYCSLHQAENTLIIQLNV